tara:strand:- start:10189 stop:11514 length:1326 start_codon:yes stop_codon:yes gene_type:complete
MINRKIIICGLGYSYHYYKNFINDNYDLKFSYNHNKNITNFDFNFYSKNKEDKTYISEKILNETQVASEYKINLLNVGNTTFGLYTLLYMINKKYPNSIVDLVGFDFRFIYEKDMIKIDDKLQSYIDIESQRVFSYKIKSLFDDLVIRYVGFDDYSDIDPKTGQLIERSVSNTEIVAEITTNHFGDFERLRSLIIGASKAGADSVKLQVRDVESFYSKEQLNAKYESPFGKKFIDYRLGLELSDDQINEVYKLCSKIGINCFFSILDKKSFLRFRKFNPKRIKLPSTISNHRNYISYVFENYHNEIVVSTGMTNQEFLDYLLNLTPNYSKMYLLHCISSYPVNILNTNLKIINKYANLSNKIIAGYSSHDIGYEGSTYALFSGAKMIEKHIKFGNTKYGHFDETALDVNTEFPDFVSKIRNAEIIYGNGDKTILDCEHHKY